MVCLTRSRCVAGVGGLRREKTAFSLVHGLNGPQLGTPRALRRHHRPPPPVPGAGLCGPSQPPPPTFLWKAPAAVGMAQALMLHSVTENAFPRGFRGGHLRTPGPGVPPPRAEKCLILSGGPHFHSLEMGGHLSQIPWVSLAPECFRAEDAPLPQVLPRGSLVCVDHPSSPHTVFKMK